MQDYGFASDVYAFGIVLWEVSAMLSCGLSCMYAFWSKIKRTAACIWEQKM